MNEQYTNVRFESINKYKSKKTIKHDLRMIKCASAAEYVKRKINGKNELVFNPNHNKENMLLSKNENGEWIKSLYKTQDNNIIDIGNNIIDLDLEEVEDRHRKLLRKNYNQSLNKKRSNSINMGVLTFSKSINELSDNDPEKIFELGVKTIQDICKELDIKLHYIIFHRDEIGNPHFQYMTDNFNSKGKTIGIKRDKGLGEKLQDIGNTYFSELGFKRGVSKKESGRKHLTIKEYQEYQDTRKEVEELKQINESLKEGIIPLVNTFLELGLNYKNKTPQEVIELFERYINGDKLDKLIKTFEKITLKSKIPEMEKVKMSEMIENFKQLNKSMNTKSNNNRT